MVLPSAHGPPGVPEIMLQRFLATLDAPGERLILSEREDSGARMMVIHAEWAWASIRRIPMV
jgi:hypothetical protein